MSCNVRNIFFRNMWCCNFPSKMRLKNNVWIILTVLVDDAASGNTPVFTASGEIACDGIHYGETKHCFTILERTNVDAPLSSNTFPCVNYGVRSSSLIPQPGKNKGRHLKKNIRWMT
mmetsp:Transcript_22238/g.22567  ORF Transcript_22238/g.22567 Transcript_22238/m.22567 type:complete len:117 (-) Transcript_22238:53-403(-)